MNRPADLILASHNAHKAKEFSELLYMDEVEPLPPEFKLPPETGETFEANALIKARAAAEALGRTVIADDSGIQAEALGGRPGVRSARFAGPNATDEQNLAKFIAEVPSGSRLRYVCVIAKVRPGSLGWEYTYKGICDGVMADEPRGENGFGYDPVFIPDKYLVDKLTMAELTPAQKNKISHRAIAVRKMDTY